MIRPARRRSMPRSAARARRNGAPRSTSSTACQSSSLHAQRQHVAGHAGIVDQDVRAAGGRLGRRDQRVGGRRRRAGRPDRRCARSPSSAASASSASRRVPDSTTLAPWACSARAIAAPMPPEAPVTSAALPSSRNMAAPLQRSSARLRSPPAWPPTRRPASGAMRLTSPDSTLPAPSSTKLSTPSPAIALHAFAPAHRGGHLLDQQVADLGRIGRLGGGDIGDQRHQRRRGGVVLQRLGHRIGGGRHQRAMERGRDRQQHRAAHALGLGDLRPRARPRRDGRRSPPGRRRCRWPARPPRAHGLGLRHRRRLRRRSPRPAPCRRPAARPSRPRRRAPPSASPARAASAGARRRRWRSCPRRPARCIRQANGRRPRPPSARRAKPPSFSSTRSTASEWAISAGWVFSVSTNSSPGPSNISRDRFWRRVLARN